MPEPVVLDGQDCYEVEEFLAERLHRGKRQLLVMWKGLDLLEATWEPLQNMPLGLVREWRRDSWSYGHKRLERGPCHSDP